MALFGQFKELFVVNYLRWHRAPQRACPFRSDAELMRILRKNNTFVIGEIKQNAARLGQPQGIQHPRPAARIRRQEQGH